MMLLLAYILLPTSGTTVLAQTATPTPRQFCPIVSEILPPDPTYIPGIPFTLIFRPVLGDWPTTPTLIEWMDPNTNLSVQGPAVQEFTIEGSPDFVRVSVLAYGMGPTPDCRMWGTGIVSTEVRRFDATPLPPSPSPSMTGTPCTPAPNDCGQVIIGPANDSENMPLTVLLEWHHPWSMPIEPFLGIEELSGESSYIVSRKIRDGLWEISNLKPNTPYVWYLALYMKYCGPNSGPNVIGGVCFYGFYTGDGLPSPTPTAIPPSPTATATPQSPTPTFATPTATTAPTPTANVLPDAWILTETIRRDIRHRVAQGTRSGTVELPPDVVYMLSR